MPKIRKKKYINKNVYEKALERIEYLYSRFDDVVVSFSGGKDSTAMLLCVIDVARKLNRLPVKAFFYDEEAIHPPTIEYVERIRERGDVDLDWYCLELKHRNACSNEQPFWYCWDKDERHLWIREKPEFAISDHPKFKKGMTMQEFGQEHYRNTNKVVVQGIRTEESLRRYRIVAMKEKDNFISTPIKGVNFAFPIYDMSSSDVWSVVSMKDEDYNKTYDVFNKTDMYNNLLRQRVCPPYGEEPIRGLYVYAECFPDMWEKMIKRVKGVGTAYRYANTDLYSDAGKDDKVSWKKHLINLIETYQGDYANKVKKNISSAMLQHKKKTKDKIPEDDPHPLTGCSWKFLCKMATRGDFKDRVVQAMQAQAEKTRNSMGITLKEAEIKHGK